MYERTDDSGSGDIFGKVFDYISQITLQDLAESVQRVGRNGFSGFQAPDRGAADLAFDLQRIRRRAPFLHGSPQRGIGDQNGIPRFPLA